MTKYKVKNLSTGVEVQVRIYKVNKDAAITPSNDFTKLDPLGSSVGIKLTPAPVKSEGAL